YLCSGISGISMNTAEEIISYSNIMDSNIPLNVDKVYDSIEKFFNIYGTELYSPCNSIDKENNSIDYFVTPYNSLNLCYEKCGSLSEAIEKLTDKIDIADRHREKSKHLLSAIKKYRNRNQKKLQKATEKLNECDKMEEYKKLGELITSNLYKLKKGDEYLQCVDYYSPDMREITIPLNPQYSPSKIAQDYFKRYNKLKRTLDIVINQIDETKEDLKYIDTIEQTLNNCNLSADLFQIEQELYTIGALKKMKNKLPKSVKEGSPILYEFKNFVIAVGKNNYQNDKLTFKTANGGDIWLHTLDYHGSHTIIFTDGETPEDDVITFAAEIASFYSNGKNSDKVPVDYTLRKYVKRNPNGKLGMVTYTNQKTSYVKP
ncbi:MAG: NFACT family protein, partial [Clostridia bacterium]|nr:NFACT family protein [Clostridia bacterium]